jgi:hypothetical protein
MAAMRTCWRIWCTHSGQRHLAAGESPQATKVVVWGRKTQIWERTQRIQRLRHHLREYFPAALEAFEDLATPGTLELLVKAPDLQGQVEGHFDRRLDAEIYLSQPSIGVMLGARVFGESGDDPASYASTNACKNYGVASPITRALGEKNVVAAWYIRNDRPLDATMAMA